MTHSLARTEPTSVNSQGSTLSSDLLPARMVNEFVYCPRLFYYEHVEGVFVDNRETTEGSLRHQKLERKEDALPSAAELDQKKSIHSRSVMLSSEPHQLTAKMDLVEGNAQVVSPVDYKRGSPRKLEDGSIGAWDTDQAQLAVQALVLRDNGYHCEEGILYYVATKQRVRVPIDDQLIDETLRNVQRARETAASGRIPPPLIDSPKCPRCSLVGVCLPDETAACAGEHEDGQNTQVQQMLFDVGPIPQARTTNGRPPAEEVRRLVPARDDLRPLYLNTQGMHVGKSGNVLKVKDKGKVVQEVRINDICQLNLFGNVQLSTQAVQTLCQNEVPIGYFSYGGWFYGVTHGLGVKNIFLRREQFRWADVASFCLRLSKALVAGKIRNQRTLLMRNHIEPPRTALNQMKNMADDAEQATALDELLGIEGNAARVYFENFAGMIKVGEDEGSGMRDEGLGKNNEEGSTSTNPSSSSSSLIFSGRNRRPPRDPVNALLSLAYSLLAKDLTIVCQTVGFDPYLGFFHQPRFGRASLALDLMEPFRSLIADSAVLSAINMRMVTSRDFIRAGESVALRPEGRKAFFRAYEQRMDTLVTHPLFGYRVNYRRVLEIQTRLLARVLTGEMTTYPVFITR